LDGPGAPGGIDGPRGPGAFAGPGGITGNDLATSGSSNPDDDHGGGTHDAVTPTSTQYNPGREMKITYVDAAGHEHINVTDHDGSRHSYSVDEHGNTREDGGDTSGDLVGGGEGPHGGGATGGGEGPHDGKGGTGGGSGDSGDRIVLDSRGHGSSPAGDGEGGVDPNRAPVGDGEGGDPNRAPAGDGEGGDSNTGTANVGSHHAGASSAGSVFLTPTGTEDPTQGAAAAQTGGEATPEG
jgi:hypothetical protein